ncbi:nucleoid-associated protein, YbaB/EbfC family [candidate division Kazan bacterium RIFCSPHIGHO2_01_FULL_49_10]|uniref:Nucleoid-associated protein, YbaB/EbfC family n=1 Tax=candidate division Kazan bacterium RIFCSPLOWO2_01_FULL_48_13 TaxID=1798539 RepID=A0A1F4PNM0_UNCK3|nr:MAG: nucleoid-associated protein, YbaB/EbfC family [candidate division Kazan bacterium RIFCSPHIGHO2_01_FULL_49_10]OGB85254.1 MAG: nucleoid-associated protein, YbaB/EbfC family [candidate division Kazan bacterium RIFCSPLOWO2_01_FULL_48_13]
MFDKAKKMWELQGKAKKLQQELRELRFEGSELGGKVRVVVDGEQKIVSINLDDSLLNPAEKDSLIKFLTQAFAAASKRAQQAAAQKTKEVMGGLGIPGL